MKESYNKILNLLDKNIKDNQKSLAKLEELNIALIKLMKD